MALKPCTECGQNVSTEAKSCPHCGKKDPTRAGTPLRLGSFMLVAIVVLLLLGKSVGNDSSGITPASMVTYAAPASKSLTNLKELVKLQLSLDFNWSKAGFDNAMQATFVFTNRSDHAVKDLTVTCKHYARSGTEIDSNTRTVYEVVRAHGKKRVSDFSMGFVNTQAVRYFCVIDDFDLAD